MAADDDAPRILTREQWLQLASLVVAVGIAALGGTAWIINTVNATGATALAAMNAQAAVVARVQSDLDHRVTALETQQTEEARATDRLTTEVEQLRGTEGDLTIAVQRLNDLLPAPARKR